AGARRPPGGCATRTPLRRAPGECSLLGRWAWERAPEGGTNGAVGHGLCSHGAGWCIHARVEMQNDEKLAEAEACLAQGGLVAIPTETVYGLAADASNELAVRRIFAAKQRPATHPLIVHLAGVEQLPRWAREIPPVARQLAEVFWPGPLTLVLPRTGLATDAITGGQDTVALRVPDHPLTLSLLKAFDGGLVAPSANRFGRVSPTTAAHVAEELVDAVEFILDGGPCRVGLESTILDLTGATPEVLRPGGTSLTALAEVLGFEPRVRQGGSV